MNANPRRCGGAIHLIVIAGLMSPIASAVSAEDGEATRNAVFNGDFAEGVTGWSKLGPGHAAASLATEKSQYAHVLITDLIVASQAMERTFSVYSPYLLPVKPGREYRMVVQASGQGEFQFGAFEYGENGHHLGNNYSERHVLTNDLEEYSFVYSASENATGIRPSIAFLEATDGTKTDVQGRIRRVEIPIPADEFDEMCESWPEYAKDARFADYQGFSRAELEELRQTADVTTVLPPYEPIRTHAPRDFALTTSRIRFDESILPARIAVLGQEVLAGPLELAVTLDDGTQLHLHPEPAAVSSGDREAVLTQQFRADGKTMALRLEMSYDAFLVYTLSFPETADAAIAGAALTIPFLPHVGKYIRYDRMPVPEAGGYGGWVFGYGPIPGKGEKVETKAVIGSSHMSGANHNDWKPRVPDDDGLVWEWSRGFLRTLWVGDEARGVSLVCLSTEGYAQQKDEPTVRLARDGEQVRLTYRFISRSVPLAKKRQLQFALQIMPPKPVRDAWVSSRFNPFFSGYASVNDPCLAVLAEKLPGAVPAKDAQGEAPPYGKDYDVVREGVVPSRWEPTGHRRYRDIGFYWYTLWSQGSRGWKPGAGVGGCSTPLVGHPERLSKLVKYSKLLGHLGLPYFAATHIATEDPAGYRYVEKTDEWTQHPRVPRPAYLRPTCPNSMFSAYIARGIGKLIDDYGIAGVYFDNCAPQLCQNTKHGCGYVDEGGTLQATLPLLGFRKLFMMVRHEFVRRGKEPFILTHAGMVPGSVSFTDVELQGEGTYGSDHTEMISLGEWRARWLGPNQFGVQLSYLPAFGYGLGPNVDRAEQQVIGTPRLLAMSLLHGTHVWNQYIDAPLVYKTWAVLDESDAADVAFIPYWEWAELNGALNGQGVYASGYGGSKGLVLVLANLGGSEREVAVPLAEIRSKNRAVNRVEDNMHGLPVRIEDGTVTCRIPPKNFRLLSFRE